MRSDSPGFGGWIVGILVVIVTLFVVIAACAWLFSFRGTDSGEVCVVREGGPFDGRAVKEVRQPGEGPKPIGAFNHQNCLPTTQRDLTEEAGNLVVPTADGVNVVVDGQALFQLKTDKESVKPFYIGFGRRKWDGNDLWEDKGWDNFLRIRMVPILYQSLRSVIGSYDCTKLNNTCVYVLNANVLADTSAGGVDKASQKAKEVNTEQNLSEAEQKITDAFQANLKAGLGDYFEGVRFQNLRVTFPHDIQARVQEAQSKRAEVATAKLEAQRRVQEAEGVTQVAKQQAEQIRVKAQAYQSNPQQAEIDKLHALCGEHGCQNLQVLGGSATKILSNSK